jgi:hypothetical protein
MLNSEGVDHVPSQQTMLTPCLTGYVLDAVLDAVTDA